jgi:hypothetical protein
MQDRNALKARDRGLCRLRRAQGSCANRVHGGSLQPPRRRWMILSGKRRLKPRFKNVTKLEPRRRVRHRLAAHVNANESTNSVAVVDRIFDAFARQTKAL